MDVALAPDEKIGDGGFGGGLRGFDLPTAAARASAKVPWWRARAGAAGKLREGDGLNGERGDDREEPWADRKSAPPGAEVLRISIGSQILAEEVDRARDHVLDRGDGGDIGLIAAGGAHQIDHLGGGVDFGKRDVAVGVGVGMAGEIAALGIAGVDGTRRR